VTQVRYVEHHFVEIDLPRTIKCGGMHREVSEPHQTTLGDAVALYHALRTELLRVEAIEE
jgi:hypothetical protein